MKKLLLIIAISFGNVIAEPPIICISSVRSGTHQLIQCLRLIGAKTGLASHFTNVPKYNGPISKSKMALKENFYEYALHHSHCAGTQANMDLALQYNAKIILNHRDPRDIVVSLAQLLKSKDGWTTLSHLSLEQMISKLINQTYILGHTKRADSPWNNTMIKSLNNIGEYYNFYLNWQNYPGDICIINYENLVGPNGGGNLETQLTEIKKIANFIGHPISDTKAQYVADHLYGKSSSFKVGQIGRWKNYFNTQHKENFKTVTQDLLLKLGYEQNDDW